MDDVISRRAAAKSIQRIGESMKIVLDEGAYMPEKAHRADAGYDLRTPKRVVIRRHESVCIDTGVHMEIPDGWYGKLESKSGLNVKHSIVSLGGTIDSGYTGSIVVILYNFGPKDHVFEKGDKIVQLVFMPCGSDFYLKQVDHIEEPIVAIMDSEVPGGKKVMNNDHMILRAEELAAKAINEAVGGLVVTPNDMYVVWFSKTLQNWKALVSTDTIHKTYVEVTHNGDKNETYCDVYKKLLNVHYDDSKGF